MSTPFKTLFLIVSILILSPAMQAAPAGEKPAAETPPGTLKVVSEELGILITWTLPEGEIRAIELLRDTDSNPKGRTRVRAFRAETTTHYDTVPDKTVPYWYWLKVTRPDGTIVTVGPVSSTPPETAPEPSTKK